MSRFKELLRTTPPTTAAVVLLCCLLHLVHVTAGPSLPAVTLCPRLVLGLGEYYRLLSSAVYHGGFLHLGMNSMSMVAIGGLLEKRIGTTALMVTIWYSMILTSLLYVAVAWITYESFLNQQGMMYQHSVGFSGVLFHLSVLECHYGPLQPRNLFGMVSVSPALYPWVLLVALQFIMPNLSFWGHLSGILVGTAQAHGYLDLILPLESTLRDLDSVIVVPITSVPSFVPTQSVPTSSSRGGLGRVLQAVVTIVRQFFEAVWVILFGRGHRLNANIAMPSLWPSRSSATTTTTASTPDPSSDPERSRLMHGERESEMV